MRRLLIPASTAIALAAAGCHMSADGKERDAGPKVARNYQVGAFSKIEVAGPYEVKVVTGGAPGVSARGGEHLLNETEVRVDGDTLEIRPRKRKGISWHWSNGTAEFTVNVAALRAAAIAGSGGITIDRVNGDFEGEVAGSGDLRLPAVSGGRIKLAIAGSGDVMAAGRADSVDIGIAGSGDIDAKGLVSRTADVSIAGSGGVAAHATESAEVSIMGSGDVDLSGGAKCKVSKMGSGNVNCS
jgi:Putative auto-transporter adhesin, head GIN domain